MEIDEKDLPYKVEYAKTGRASCKGCKTPIGQGTIRIAVMVQSSFFDGKQPNWFHEHCFFNKQRPTSEGDFANFYNLKTADQKKLIEKIGECSSSVVTATAKGGKGKKRTKNDAAAAGTGPIKDFGIEYAKSGRAACAGCQQKISKDEIRVKKTVYDTEIGIKFGGQALWHHVECFAELRGELCYMASGQMLPGFSSLTKNDQEIVKKAIPEMKMEDMPDTKKPKLEPKDEIDKAEEDKLNTKLEAQSKLLYKYRNFCTKELTKNKVRELLEYNNQIPATHDSDKLYNQAADMLAFGALKACNICKGQFHFNRSGYLCNGNLTEWVKCTNLVKEPPKKPCKIPDELKEEYNFLNKYKGKVEIRAIKYVPPSATTIAKTIKKDEDNGPRVKRERPPLYNLTFVINGLKSEEDNIKIKIQKLGGKVNKRIDEKTIAIISDEEMVKKMGSQMKRAKELGIHVIPIDYLDIIKDDPSGVITYISSKSICDWGTDPSVRIPPEEDKSQKSKSIYTKSVPKSMKLKLKGGLAVDPDSNLDDVAHVYKSGTDIYNAVLGLTDIQKNKNSFYKLQILESDNKNRFWVFRSWGRIGTTIGGNKVDDCGSLYDAMKIFKSLYLDKTGNDFEDRDNFTKRPGLMYPIDVDYADDEHDKLNNINSDIKSKLPEPVQDLIKLLFDVDAMKKVMLEFDLDMEKMPLGKLSQKQIQEAYKVLSELLKYVQDGAPNHKFIDASNRFYTLIPHNFGVDNPPILETSEQIKHHSELLDNLMEIECAYSMLKGDSNDNNKEENPIDQHYQKLKTELIPIDKNHDEFKLLERYVQNTHAETHRSYDLQVMEIFKVSRSGEARRYKPFKKLHNRKLLWHGSRLTNFAGILSHGLKIAPPEAPATGYMFGKGIYFADMVSKSANYCCTSKQNSTGLMLLSEVALGNMHELNNADYITKLPKDKHSVKGIGRTEPNPNEIHCRDDGVEIPLGKSVTDLNGKSSLLYNEFIVYDVAQISLQKEEKLK